VKNALKEILAETLESVRVDRVLHEHLCGGGLDALDLGAVRDAGGRIGVVAMGKAARPMARVLVDLLTTRHPEFSKVVRGWLVEPEGSGRRDALPGLTAVAGGHPLPTMGSFLAAEAVQELAWPLRDVDLAVFLVSGGASALLEKPWDPAYCFGGRRRGRGDRPCLAPECVETWQAVYRELITCGAGIEEINALRKHLSAVKGGRLAQAAWPARQVTLLVDDVPPGQLSAVSSGPTLPDETTVDQCYDIAREYGLVERLPASVAQRLRKRDLVETPKPGDPFFARARWESVLSNDDAVRELAEAARGRDWVVEVDRSVDEADVDAALEHLLGRLRGLAREQPGQTVCLVAGGEVRCRVTGDGRGGRNQAFVLRAVERIVGQPVAVLSAGTDGIDGNSPAAGAVADGQSLARARALGLDPAEFDRRSDACAFFERLGDCIVTGRTGHNVRDVRALVTCQPT
jgi:glycerate 2-kinase